jgi:UDP-N-acetyl-D-mannosaminuronate dehydrogenase
MKWKKRSNVMIMRSFAYRENVADTRESPMGGVVGGLWRSISRGNASVGVFSGCSGEF